MEGVFDILKMDLVFTCFGGNGSVGVLDFVCTIVCVSGKGTVCGISDSVIFLLVKSEASFGGVL